MKKLVIFFLLLSVSAFADIFALPSPVPMTPAQAIAAHVIQVLQTVIQTAPVRLKTVQNMIWNSPGVKPCDVIVGLGANGKQALMAASGAGTFLNSVSPGIVPSPTPHPGYTITPQSDGTAVCVAPSPRPSPSPSP